MTDEMHTEGDLRRPDVFIVGAMKCGTTILFDFLTTHDDIVSADEKECHYFSLYFDRGEDWYLNKFPKTVGNKHLIDASPTYFDMCIETPIVERMKAFSPDAKIIILIRNPVQRMISHFNHLRKINKIEALENLSLDDLVERNWRTKDDDGQLEAIRSMLVRFSVYEEKVDKFIAAFGQGNVIVVNNDDLRSHGKIVVPQIFEFLGLRPPEGTDFTVQKYLHGSDRITLSKKNYFCLLEEFGSDYYRTCRMGVHLRPTGPINGPVFNQPIGALVDGVGVGEDGWLFLAAGSNNVLEMYISDEAERRKLCEVWHKIISERAGKLLSMGARYHHVLVPEKMTLLGDKLHWPIQRCDSWGATLNRTAPNTIRDNIIDLIGYMGDLDNPEKYFLKTDSHWNFFGAFVAYQLICTSLGYTYRKDLLNRGRSHGTILFDLGGKLPDRPTEDAFFVAVREDAEIVSDEGLVRYKKESNRLNDGGLHVGSFIQFHNSLAPNKERVIIFGDSFSEFRDHSLTALMAETFEHTVFIWSTGIDYKFCRDFSPTVVFSIMTERFIRREPDDQFDYRAYTEERLRSAIM